MIKHKITSKKTIKSFLPWFRFNRIMVLWRNWGKTVTESISIESQELSPYQEKIIRLFRLTIKNPNSKLALNTNGVRQVEKDNISISYDPFSNNNGIMTIIYITDNNKSLFELTLPTTETKNILDMFDNEMEKRVRKIQSLKNGIIEKDIDGFLFIEEKLLKN